jgi:hypothetical protein
MLGKETQVKKTSRLFHVASLHSDRRAAASISLLLALSIPIHIQESLLWKNLTVVRDGTYVTIIGRFLKLEVHSGSASARYLDLAKLRCTSKGPRVFGKSTQGSPQLVQLVEDLLLRANVLNCSHRDLLEWSRRQTDAFRRCL